jgi:solute carrier family 25 citrate transporter 1
LGFFGVGAKIVKNESVWALYKGLGAVVSGIVPKMAIRFSSFEFYKSALADPETQRVSTKATFLGKLVSSKAGHHLAQPDGELTGIPRHMQLGWGLV